MAPASNAAAVARTVAVEVEEEVEVEVEVDVAIAVAVAVAVAVAIVAAVGFVMLVLVLASVAAVLVEAVVPPAGARPRSGVAAPPPRSWWASRVRSIPMTCFFTLSKWLYLACASFFHALKPRMKVPPCALQSLLAPTLT